MKIAHSFFTSYCKTVSFLSSPVYLGAICAFIIRNWLQKMQECPVIISSHIELNMIQLSGGHFSGTCVGCVSMSHLLNICDARREKEQQQPS